ncbi:MAG: hypothetical protein BGO11_03270 [Solirubrobacterales bacterium 70-9]|nr:MAG: hypothetical protein BGO11_03270 [Solirubrobacterales bacterium 70-9]
MRAFVVESFDRPPVPAEFQEPRAGEGVVLEVSAAGLNPFDAVYAAGRHPIGRPPLPSVVGREGVGRTADGRRVFFEGAEPPFGSLAPRVLVREERLLGIRDEIDDATAIALGSAGITAWLALAGRAEIAGGESVVILGATGAVGSAAVQIAKLLGARRVVAVGRDSEALARTRRQGADASVEIGAEQDLAAAIEAAADGAVEVVLDLLWGPPARAALQVASPGARLVQVGSSAALETPLPANPWRTRGVSLLGFSVLTASPEEKAAAYELLLGHAAAGRIETATEVLPFAEIERAWELLPAGGKRKLILAMPHGASSGWPPRVAAALDPRPSTPGTRGSARELAQGRHIAGRDDT